MGGKKQNGFTLIEVLIALVILAIAFSAVMLVMRSSVYQTDRVQTQLAANWVAMNVISSMQLGLQAPPTKDLRMDGSEPMNRQVWSWRARVSENSNPHYKRITVSVYQNDHLILQRDGFLWRVKQ